MLENLFLSLANIDKEFHSHLCGFFYCDQISQSDTVMHGNLKPSIQVVMGISDTSPDGSLGESS